VLQIVTIHALVAVLAHVLNTVLKRALMFVWMTVLVHVLVAVLEHVLNTVLKHAL
jgi:hypothetical protein